ncbi:MAG: hypothetical protein M3203_07805 [Actinomycetota bacterium]|nr:hypothetical protein [Actinomycetota bacterium]
MGRRPLAVALAGAVLAGCGGGGESSRTTTTAAPTTTVAPTTTTLADLGRLFVRMPPRPGFTPVPEKRGPFTLEGYLRDFSDEPVEERALLSAAGFVQGSSRAWADRASRPTTLAVFIFEFQEGADLGPVRDQLLRHGRGVTRFDVPSIAGATGVSAFVATQSARERAHEIGFVRGSRLFVVAAQHANLQASTDLVIDMAKAQAELVS